MSDPTTLRARLLEEAKAMDAESALHDVPWLAELAALLREAEAPPPTLRRCAESDIKDAVD